MADATVITAEQARREGHDTAGGDLRKLAMTNLLGLNTDFGYWNPDLAGGADATSDETQHESDGN